MSQIDLAGRLGLDVSALSKLELGRNSIPSARASASATVLNVDPQEVGLMFLAHKEQHLFAMALPGASLEPVAVPKAAIKQAMDVLERRAAQMKAKRGRNPGL